jgi:hypothetical protein
VNLQGGLFLFLRDREDGLQVDGRFATLDTFSDYTKRQSPYLGDRLFASCAVYHDTWQVWHLSDPATVIFSIYFDRQYRHDCVQAT